MARALWRTQTFLVLILPTRLCTYRQWRMRQLRPISEIGRVQYK